MARAASSQNGHSRLEEALATLIAYQAAFIADQRESYRIHADFERRHQQYERETSERFARIETQMAEIIRVLSEHNRQLERLTEAVREKIGFRRPE